jgi:hypothetical protein
MKLTTLVSFIGILAIPLAASADQVKSSDSGKSTGMKTSDQSSDVNVKLNTGSGKKISVIPAPGTSIQLTPQADGIRVQCLNPSQNQQAGVVPGVQPEQKLDTSQPVKSTEPAKTFEPSKSSEPAAAPLASDQQKLNQYNE